MHLCAATLGDTRRDGMQGAKGGRRGRGCGCSVVRGGGGDGAGGGRRRSADVSEGGLARVRPAWRDAMTARAEVACAAEADGRLWFLDLKGACEWA